MGNESSQSQQKDNHEPANAEKSAPQEKTPSPASSYLPAPVLSVSGASSADDIPFTRDNILHLQRTVGNRAVVQLLQRKAKLSQPGDLYEQEADRVAENVIQKSQEPGQAVPILRIPADGTTAVKGPLNFLSTDKLPPDVEANMEMSFGADFSGVRIHQDSQADSLGALAYTRGSDIHIASGQYDPHTQGGKELLGHELTHVLQQSEGHVGTTGVVKGMPLNDDPALEQEADDLGARAARGERVGRGLAASSSGVALAQMKADPDDSVPEDVVERSGEEWVVSLGGEAETPADTAQLKVAGRPIQARAAQGPIQRNGKKTTYVPYQIYVKQSMTQEEFRAAAMRQIFGGVLKHVEWHNSKDSYVPEKSPYTLQVDTQLLKRQRGQASKDRGLSVGAEGDITGAKERAKTFHAGPESDEKSALMKEIDRRYFEAIGDKTETQIKPGEKGKSELWRMIRDEVLFQHEYIANLPPKVQELIKFGIKGKDLTPADYDKLFAIAKKIEKMPAGQVGDYASKVTATTTDLNAFEASLDKYLAEVAERDKQSEERDTIKTKLAALEEVYKKYRAYRSAVNIEAMAAGAAAAAAQSGVGGVPMNLGPTASSRLYKELETELQAHGFAGVAEFEVFIKQFEKAFEQEAANIAKDLLAKYAGKLYQESERYKNPAEVAALHQKLGGVRKDFSEAAANAKIWNDYIEASEQSRIPGQAHLRPKISLGEAMAARAKAEEADADAQSQIKGISGDHPIFQEEGLPLDKRINKVALAKANESELGGLLQGHIQNRMKDIGEARAEIEGKPELIYKMENLMPQFYVQQGIKPDSIYDMIIQDKMKSDLIMKIVKGIVIAIVAVALAVVSFGTATPAIIAAGAGIAGAGLGVYQAYESYQEYAEEKKLADVGFAKDPSVVWLVIAVAGAALDMAAAVKAVSALGKAAKVLDAGGDLKAFTNVVRQLEKEKEITSEIARAAEKAAEARKGFAEATGELTKAMSGKLYSFPGPLADPDVYKAVVKMARQAIKTKVYDAQKFIEELKLARVNAKLGEMNPQELAKVKAAWEEAKVLEAAEKGLTIKGILETPQSIWGRSQAELEELLLKEGWTKKGYSGTSTAYEFIKDTKEGRFTIVANYGGGRHTHAMGKQTFETPFYYKIQGPGMKKTKVIDAKLYPQADLDKETFRFIDGPTGTVVKE